MRDHKFKAIFNGLDSIARKVYDAVPAKESWTLHQITEELHRIHPTVKEHRVILGCIQKMTNVGVITAMNSKYCRVPVVSSEKESKAVVLQADVINEPKAPEAVMSTPIEKISQLQKQVAKIAENVAALSAAIDTVAIEVEIQFSEQDVESQKLKQLQSLLKGLV